MPREILRAKLYELIKNIEDESILIGISNYLDRIAHTEKDVDFKADDLSEFVDDNLNIISE